MGPKDDRRNQISYPNQKNHRNFWGLVGFSGKTSCFHRIYALLFLVELILRVLAEGCPFFWSSPNVVWNYLDTHGGIVELFCIVLHILLTLFLSVFFGEARKGPSERIIQVVPMAPASFPASLGSVVENCHLLGENTLLQNTHWFQCSGFCLDGMLAFLCESRLFQKPPPEKTSIQP